MILTDLIIAGLIGYSAYTGARRGLLLIALELVSFVFALLIGFLFYQSFGAWIKVVATTTAALANVAAFILLWVAAELVAALVIRFWVLPRLLQSFHPGRLHQIGGATLNALKTMVILSIGLILFAGLPLSATTKQPVTDAFLAKPLLSSSSHLQRWIAGGLGRDLSDSLNFFTVPSNPEHDKRIELGFTTTAVKVDEASERYMLELVNQERTSQGLRPLTVNTAARAVARDYSRRMLAEGYFSHIDNNGGTPFDRMRAGQVAFTRAGENLALAPTLRLAHQGLMNSPGHRANILSASYRTVGIGIIDAGPYGLMVTQNFTD